MKEQLPTCNRCDSPLENHVCRKCNTVHCPICGKPEQKPCEHLVADWAGCFGRSEKFYCRSPFIEGILPYLDVECDSELMLIPVDEDTALGDLSPLLIAFPNGLFEPPNPVLLFKSILGMISADGTYVGRREPGCAGVGGHLFWFSSDPTTAKAKMTSIIFSLWERMTELKSHLQDQLDQERKANKASEREEVVYGEINESLVFIKKKDAQRIWACHRALGTAKTWGEFRSLVDPESYNRLIEVMDASVDFEAFCEEQPKSEPGLTPEEAKAEFMKMSIGDRLPEDSDAFSQDHVPWTYDGDWPDWPAKKMLNWVPESIQEQYGTIESSMLNGEFLTFACSDARKIAAAFRRAGYRCVRNDKLVERASGYS